MDDEQQRHPELAVIVPCYNVAATLEPQLDSLASQAWNGEWEVVIVDNGSTDETPAIIAGYTNRFAHMRGIHATEGQSVAYARNTGAGATNARAVVFCDGDDIVQQGWVAAMGEALRSADFVTGSVDPTGINEAWLAESRPGHAQTGVQHFGEVAFARGNNCGMVRALWQELDGFDEDFRGLEDIEFSIRAAAAGYVPTHVPDAVVAYRFRPELSDVWHQGVFYGRGRKALRDRATRAGLKGPTRSSGFKSWIWLVIKLPTLTTRSGRFAWTWVLASRVGALRGMLDR